MIIPSLMAYSAWGLVALRIALAATFFAHGKMKMGMWSADAKAMADKTGMTVGMVNTMKFLSVAETLGAVGVLVGLLTQLAALGLAIIMAGAIYMKVVKWKLPFANLEKNGWELDLILLAGALMVYFAGPGMFAIDLLLK